jgi:predicted component of type VI protein secretion system
VSNQTSSLEAEIEETRERLAATIDQLLHRSSPKTIVSREITSVKAYFVDPTGAPRTDNILKVAGTVVGVVALFTVIRRVVR